MKCNTGDGFCWDQAWAIKQMQNEGRSIILVTHDTSTVENFCDSAVVLDHGKLLAQGDTKSVVAAYQALP